VLDSSGTSWISGSVSVPPDDYQYLIADSDDVAFRRSLFLISLNRIIYIKYEHRHHRVGVALCCVA
jgi:hypothetical protein